MAGYFVITAILAVMVNGCVIGDGSSLRPISPRQLDSNTAPVRYLQETVKAIYQVKIEDKDAGTAFLYNSSKGLVFVTALHTVLGYEKKPGVITLQSGDVSLKVLSVMVPSLKYDIAFLRAPPLAPPQVFFYFEKTVQPLNTLTFSEIQMVSYGLFHADYRTPFISNGFLQHTTPFALILTMSPTNIGSSGAPVFLKGSYGLIGMLTKEITLDDTIQRGVASAISIDVIENLADNFNH